MKKMYHPIDIPPKQGQELTKKLYRTISEQAKRLDDTRSCARTISDLFAPSLQVQRRKFCEYCERLIFSEPLQYGKKGEELLWRKGYYDVVAAAKKLKKNEYTPEEVSCIQAHINAGIGFYYHVISKIQYEFRLNLKGMTDFAIFDNGTEDKHENISKEQTEWAEQAVHQCMIYLGDLSRYKLEIYHNWEPHLSVRYYLQAISFKPDYGMPHNQMGTLAMSRNNYLDAVYHYLRCMACKFPFEGTTNNLHGLFETNAKFIEQLPDNGNDENADCIIEPGRSDTIKQFLARFLLLIDIWYFNKKVTNIYSLCHQTYKNLEECLSFSKPSTINSESGDTPTTDLDSIDTDSVTAYLTGDMLFKMAAICLLCISKLKKCNSAQLSTLIAFTLGVYSQIVQSILGHIQEDFQGSLKFLAVLNYPLPEESKHSKLSNGIIKDLMNGGKKRSKSKLRRRKPLNKIDSDEESDTSENDNENVDDSSSSDDDSFISDTEDVLAESSDEEIDAKVSNESLSEKSTKNQRQLMSAILNKSVSANNAEKDVILTQTNGTEENKTIEDVVKKSQRMDVSDMLEIISEESAALQSVKILNDWLKTDVEVLRSCGQNTRSLIRQIVHLVNLININVAHVKIPGVNFKISEVITKENKIPLSEDVVLKGVDVLQDVQKNCDWDYMPKKGVTSKLENVIRIVKLISFGKFLTEIDETGVVFDENKNIFVCKSDEKINENVVSATAVMEELERQEQESATLTNGIKLNLNNSLTNSEFIKPTSVSTNTKMKHMGQLWLAAEVRALESRVGSGKPALSPYLVLDADALIKYTSMVKNLVYSRKFIVLVPAAVVSALDDLKREKLEARDAIRWLESQFHRGNRFFRSQRPHERASIPFIRFPKKKDKEMHVYIQIVECCHFLAKQQKNAKDVVTLLVGNHNILNGENKDFSYAGLAQSIGVTVESIANFHGKWKKNKGNR